MDEKEAKNQRGRVKSALTRIYNFVSDETQTFRKNDILNKLEKLESIYFEFDKFDACLPIQQSEMEEFENKYYETKAKLQDCIEKLSIVKNNENVSSVDVKSINSMDNFRLPRININSFSGKYADFTSFKDLYESLVHKNESLTNIQKFQYLKGLLTDEPAAIIKHIPISENSYEEAWEKILVRYDRKKQIVSSLIKTFLDQPNVNCTNASNLRNIADTSDEVIRGLKSLDSNATSRDVWLIYILLQKIDTKTRQEWADKTVDNDFPSVEEFLEFLNNKCASLELYEEIGSEIVPLNKKERTQRITTNTYANKTNTNASKIVCPKCKGPHFLFKCAKFREKSIQERKLFVKKHRLCYNCLSDKHISTSCNSSFKCHFCQEAHHSLLHEKTSNSYVMTTFDSQKEKNNQASCLSPQPDTQALQKGANPESCFNGNISVSQAKFGLLPTASVRVQNASGALFNIRILFDSGSQTSIIAESCVKALGLERKNARFPIKGLSDTKIGLTKGCVEVILSSRHNPKIKLPVNALILDNMINLLPSEKLELENIEQFGNLQLGDPEFNIPNKIDMIIGADHFFTILLPGLIKYSNSDLIAQNSIFGFLVSGKLPAMNTEQKSSFHLHVYELNIDKELQRFWELEEISSSKDTFLSPEEQFVEKHFQENYFINSDGRFVVKLPMYKMEPNVSGSKHAAISRLYAMERKFKENVSFEKQYKDFMREYEQLGHMEIVQNDLSIPAEHFYLPHHAVLKPSSTTTKLRVVFDASSQGKNGLSLNSILGVGPKLQRDISEILLNFRMPKIVFTADIEKMYRQILVAEEDQNYQLIVWRYNTDDKVRTYKLKTVTYGLASSSFLATRCIKQIALDYKEDPTVTQILLENVYMDDLLAGANTTADAVSICQKIVSIFQPRGFNLRKWNSNSKEFLTEYQEKIEPNKSYEITPDSSEHCKVLGLNWNPSTDTFNFKAALHIETPLTKRKILSESARIFDPLGLISPCTVVIKIFYQKLWLTKGDWDSPIPSQLESEWITFQESFHEINHLIIPRCVTFATDSTLQLHGFADASSLAFSAAIYCRQVHNGEVNVNLLISKTKVAPIKQVSIPRLELCGAHLLSKLFRTTLNTLKDYQFKVFAWTDSKVVLSWLSAPPRKWKTFVANRTSQIIEILPTRHWNHVPSKENPADVASRGINPKLLGNCKLWWHGPQWLKLDSKFWPMNQLNDEVTDIEVKTEQRNDPLFNLHTHASNELFENLFEHFSSLSKIIRVLAYCQRFIKNCQRGNEDQACRSNATGPLKFTETHSAEQKIILWVQRNYFSEDLKCIAQQQNLASKSQLRSLHPFIDENGILRVGGRLASSELTFNKKHPIILPSKHKISELLVREQHIRHLHAGPTLLAHIIRQSYWIVGGKKLINSSIHHCVKCHRFSASTASPLMGNLPAHRVTLKRPFFSCGIDYAGPIYIKFNKGRGAKSTKGYICLFICLSTKAVHIEAVSDLTADAFIAALRRFSSRRGAPSHIYCDNGSNFVGARRKLNEIQQLLLKLPEDESLSHYFNKNAIEWHFIPPASPHFGGIWESGIRSVKHHLKRSMGDSLLTFEELTTLLTQIEGLLNSRPLTHTDSSDSESINLLTPAHFLTGDILTSIPEDIPSTTCSTRWQLIQNLRRSIWKRWNHEYLTTLQQRSKWQRSSRNLKIGDVVLIKEDGTPPGSWPLGRIKELHPGADSVARVATIKTHRGLTKRPVRKLAPLPYISPEV